MNEEQESHAELLECLQGMFINYIREVPQVVGQQQDRIGVDPQVEVEKIIR